MSKKKDYHKKLEHSNPNQVAEKKTLYTALPWIKEDFMALGILSVLSFVIYYASFSYGYVLDDLMMIRDNKFTEKGFAGIIDHLTNESMTGYLGSVQGILPGNRYRPLSLMTFAFERGLMGKLVPSVSHFINILIYIATCLVIYRFVKLIAVNLVESTSAVKNWIKENASLFALVVALLYAAHPLHVEAVANIKGRDEIMCMLFSILSLKTFYNHSYSGKTKQLMIALIWYFLALLSKENAITFLAIIPLTIYCFHGRNYLKPLLPLLAVTVFYLIFRVSMSGMPEIGKASKELMNNPFLGMSGLERLATTIYTLGLYIKLLLFPHPLTHDYYPYAIPVMDFGKWQVWLSLAIYLGLIIFGMRSTGKKSVVGYSILYFLITLTIVSNLVINVGTFLNDRFMFMPSLALCLLLAYGFVWLANKFNATQSSKILIGLSLLFLIPYTARSFTRVPAWENEITLNKSAFPASKNSARANSFMSTALYEEAKVITNNDNERLRLLKEARPYAKKALDIYPTYLSGHTMLAGIAGETFTLDRSVDNLLEDFYTIAITRPDVNQEQRPDGKLSSFLTKYLDYLNTSIQGDPKLKSWYVKTLEAISQDKDSNVKQWGLRIGELGLEGFPQDADITIAINKIRVSLGQ